MRGIVFLVIAVTFGVVGFSMVFPLLPYMLRLHGASSFWQVAVFSVFAFASFFASPFWGRLSDKFGRKNIILLAILGSGFCCLWLYFVGSAVEIYANRALAGLFAGWLGVSQAYIGDRTGADNRVPGMAIMGIAFGIGFTCGPLLSSFLIDDWQTHSQFFRPAIVFALGFYSIALLLVLFLVTDSHASHATGAERERLSVRLVLSHAPIAKALLLVILFQLVFTAMESTLALWVFDSFAGGPKDVGKLLAVAGIASLFMHGSVAGFLGKRLSAMYLAVLGIGFLAAALVSLVWAGSRSEAYIVMVLAAFGHGLFVPACTGFLSNLAPLGWQGGVMGFLQSAHNLSRIGGPMSGGYLYSLLGSRWVYVVLLVPLLPAVFLAWRVRRLHLQTGHS